jgi:hypothetical protein
MLETKSSVIIETLMESIESQTERFVSWSFDLSSVDQEISEAMAMVAAATAAVFNNLLPLWKKNEEQWVPNIHVSPAKISFRSSKKSKVQQWFTWSVELKEIAMAFDDNEYMQKAVLDLSEAYKNVGKTFESKLKKKKQLFVDFELPSFCGYEFCTPKTANDVMDGLMAHHIDGLMMRGMIAG